MVVVATELSATVTSEMLVGRVGEVSPTIKNWAADYC